MYYAGSFARRRRDIIDTSIWPGGSLWEWAPDQASFGVKAPFPLHPYKRLLPYDREDPPSFFRTAADGRLIIHWHIRGVRIKAPVSESRTQISQMYLQDISASTPICGNISMSLSRGDISADPSTADGPHANEESRCAPRHRRACALRRALFTHALPHGLKRHIRRHTSHSCV